MNNFDFEATKISGEAKMYVHMNGTPPEVGVAADRMINDVNTFLKANPGGEQQLQASFDQARKQDPTLPEITISDSMLLIKASGQDPEKSTHVLATSR